MSFGQHHGGSSVGVEDAARERFSQISRSDDGDFHKR
jgi:hypothetical protein